MAYSFNGSTQYLRAQYNTNSLLGAWPCTIFCRAKSSDLANSQVAASWIYANSPYNGLLMILAGAIASDPSSFSRFGVASVNGATYDSGAWIAFAGRGSSNTVFDVDVDGAVVTGPTTSTSWANSSDVQIGARLTPSISLPLTGSVAAVAIWDVALTDADVAQLVAGFSPRRVRPQSLRWYAPLVRDLSVVKQAVNPISALAGTASPTVSDHPRSYGF